MAGEVDKEKIVFFIKNYYEKNKDTPSMKVISEECGINPRTIYKLFKNQKKAFEIAGVPYSDEKRKKVEPANVARRKPPAFKVVSEKKIIYWVDKNRLDDYRSQNINGKFDEIPYKVANIKNSLLQSNPQDKAHIRIAHDTIKQLINAIYIEYVQLEQQYQMCKTLKNAPVNIEKVYLADKGFDFDDIDGSYQELKEKIFYEKRIFYDPSYDWKASYYYNKLLSS